MTHASRAPRWWLASGVVWLAVAGLYALVIVVARTPQLASLSWFQGLFHKALVVHVDLSVLVWFLAIACTMWSREAARSTPRFPLFCTERAACIAFNLGALFIAGALLDPSAAALMSNYIPVLASPVFFLGLSLVGVGVALQAAYVLLHRPRARSPESLGARSAAWIGLMALACFVASFRHTPAVLEAQQYFEVLFWGGGHVLQLLHTQVLVVVWLALAALVLPGWRLSGTVASGLLVVGALVALAAVVPYLFYDVNSVDFRQFFTHHMMAVGGLPSGILALLLLWHGRRLCFVPAQRAVGVALLCSALLFLYGGVLALMIEGQNVTIPAHYHGSIVGITLAFMGFAVWVMPEFGWRPQAATRLAVWQPVVIAVGQAMHISGLAWSGGYGVLRKTPGALEGTAVSAKVAMGLMGAGGLVAIIGGFLFVVVMWRAVRSTANLS